MKKIAALHRFIIDLNLFAAEQMDSYVDDLTINPSCRDAGTPGQIIVNEKDYTATFYIERYPHGEVSEDALFAQISAWLNENDTDRTETVNFPIIVEILDDETANLQFGILFNEPVLAQEAADGPILVNGKRYALL